MHQMPQVIRHLAIMGLILVTLCACDDDRAKQEVTSLLEVAVPPNSVCISEPRPYGLGNNPKTCHGYVVKCVIGSSLTQSEVEDYYRKHLSDDWEEVLNTDDALTWLNTQDSFDKLIGIEYRPAYVSEDSQPARELEDAQKRYATGYVLTVLADDCKGTSP